MNKSAIGEFEPHFWLTRSVARCMGLSLSDAMADGRLSPEDYAELITRCRIAGCREACHYWLAAQRDDDRPAPEFCANAERLNRLR